MMRARERQLQESIKSGRAAFEMESDEHHHNPMGTLHGEVCCDRACASKPRQGEALPSSTSASLGRFEPAVRLLDEDHGVRPLLSQLLLGQLEARFSLFRRRVAIRRIPVVSGGAQVVTPLMSKPCQLLMVADGVHRRTSTP